MRFAVLASSESRYLLDLQRAAGARHELVRATYRDLVVECFGRGDTRLDIVSGNVGLFQCDALLVRTMPAGSLEQIVFRMDALGALAARMPVVNPPRAIETAVDKFLCTARLAEAGIAVPRTFVAQTPEQALRGFDAFGGRAVVKPIFGAEGRGITLIEDRAIAERTFDLLAGLGGVIYLQELISHSNEDFRILVVGERTWTIRRKHPTDWRTNLARGAIAEPVLLSQDVIELAVHAARVVGAPLAGVDLLFDERGKPYIIEVNAVPGWLGLAKALDIDIAAVVLGYLEQQVRK